MPLLDRGWGKPPLAHTGENGEGGIEVIIRQVVEGGDEALDARVIDRDAPKPLGHTLGHKRY